jgi:hypothetical protein
VLLAYPEDRLELLHVILSSEHGLAGQQLAEDAPHTATHTHTVHDTGAHPIRISATGMMISLLRTPDD